MKTHNSVQVVEDQVIEDHINDEEIIEKQEVVESEADKLLLRITSLPSTSARIRALHKAGMTNSGIVSYLNTHFMQEDRPHPYRYQHVRNVLTQKVVKE